MIFELTSIPGAYVVRLEPVSDHRGWFARSFDVEQFRERGLDPTVVQCGVSANPVAGTLRGMHYQEPPHAESKLIRCARGAIYDVIVDLRRGSTTYCDWFATELTQDDPTLLYVPENVAHGFLTLRDDTEVHYQMSTRYEPTHTRGVRYDDPAFRIQWPQAPRVMSSKDRSLPDFRP